MLPGVSIRGEATPPRRASILFPLTTVRLYRRNLVGRVRNVLTVLIAAADMDGVQGPPGWRIHPLSGDRAGTWSISVSGNWRITFDLEQGKIANLDLEDYH